MLRQLLGILSITAATAALAEPQKLTAEKLTELVPGSTIALDTPIGTKIPMRFGRDGIVSGEAGVLGAYLGAAKDRGRWTVENGKLCIKWFRWFDSEPRCMEISAEGDKITWRQDDGDTGTGTVVERGAVAQGAPAKMSEPKIVAKKPAAPKVAIDLKVAGLPAKAPAAAAPPADHERMMAGAASEPEAAPALPASEVQPPVVVPPATTAGGPEVKVINPSPEPVAAPIVASESAVAAAEPAPVAVAEAEQVAPAVAERLPPAAASPASAPVKPAPPKAPVAKAAAKPAAVGPSFRVARVEANDMLNIRSAPSEDSKAVGVISSNGRGVKITGACDGEWCPVRHGGVTGWVNRYYLAQE